jgi:hypothetical protein
MIDRADSVSAAPQRVESKPAAAPKTETAPDKEKAEAKHEEPAKEPEDMADLTDAGKKAVEEESGTPDASDDADTADAEDPEQEAAAAETADPPAAQETQTLPADFNKMSPEQQYNYLHDVAVSMAGGDESVWRTGDKEVNLIGIRSFTDGQAHDQQANKYDDTIYAVRMVDGKPEVYAFQGSVDAGKDPGGTKFGYDGPEGHGFSHVADGSYAPGTFVKTGGGHWGVDTVLGQAGDLKINVDFNNDAVIEDNERINKTEGAGWGIFFHPGGQGENVGSWSAGCQVIKPDQYGTFQHLLQDDPNMKFGYTLVDGHNLPPVDENNKAVGVPNNPIVADGTGGHTYTGGTTAPPATTGTADPAADTGGVTAPPANPQPSHHEAPAPEGYAPPAEGSPYGATSPLSNFMNVDAENVDEQLTALCEAALTELQNGQQGGAMGQNMMMLYTTYANALMQKLPINPDIEQKVISTLAQGGINAEQLKTMLNSQQNQMGMPLDGMYQGRNPAMIPGVGGLNFTA